MDAAAKESDPLRRIAYVAAFAMSNYSSTIGRIAKPFNPMLVRVFVFRASDPDVMTRAKRSSMFGWTSSTGTCQSK